MDESKLAKTLLGFELIQAAQDGDHAKIAQLQAQQAALANQEKLLDLLKSPEQRAADAQQSAAANQPWQFSESDRRWIAAVKQVNAAYPFSAWAVIFLPVAMVFFIAGAVLVPRLAGPLLVSTLVAIVAMVLLVRRRTAMLSGILNYAANKEVSQDAERKRLKGLVKAQAPEDMLNCPVCDAPVKARNLLQHFNKQHCG